jgi:uncharacterized membrane protein HdeD (DUF308 family)
MLHELSKNWWLILLKGICSIIFGVLAFAWPGITLLSLVLLYGAFALADGALAIAAAVTGGEAAPRWWLALVGIIGIGAGLVTLLWPGITAIILLFFIAAWAIATGIMEIVGAIRLRKEIDDEWMLIASGVLSVLFGCLLAFRPATGALSLIFVIGTFAVFFGILQISFALRLRRHASAMS